MGVGQPQAGRPIGWPFTCRRTTRAGCWSPNSCTCAPVRAPINGVVELQRNADAARSSQAIQGITYNAKGQKMSFGSATARPPLHLRRRDLPPDPPVHAAKRRHRRQRLRQQHRRHPRPQRPGGVQNLHYIYDPVGNITHIDDEAQEDGLLRNSRDAEPSSDYIYDALYRLIEATGRENAAAAAAAMQPGRPVAARRLSLEPTQLRNYTQRYRYDAVGNFVAMAHQAGVGNGWTRHYTTQPDSNRLDQTWYGEQHARGRHLLATTPTAACSTSIGCTYRRRSTQRMSGGWISAGTGAT